MYQELSSLPPLGVGLLAARLVVGLAMAAHGTQKLLGWFRGPGLDKTGEFFAYLGFQPGRTFATVASLTELAGGLLVATGFLGPVGPALIVSVMVVAIATVHWQHGLFAGDNGIEVPMLYIVTALVLVLTGYGRFSVDTLFGLEPVWTATIRWLVLGAGVLGGLANLVIRHRPAQQGAQTA